jgi:hypothetical protein
MKNKNEEFDPKLIFEKLKALNDKIEADMHKRKMLDLFFSIAEDDDGDVEEDEDED